MGIIRVDQGGGRDLTRAEEAALVRRVQAREPEAYERLVRLYGPRMLVVAHHFFRDDADAHDVVQDALVSVHRAIGGFNGRSRLSTWLHRVVVNAALSRLRVERRHPASLIDDLFPETWEPTTTGLGRSVPETGDAWISRGEERTEVRASVERLPADYRSVVVLHDLEGVEVPTVGDLLEMTRGSAKMRLHRGHRVLRGLLDGFVRGGRRR